MPNLKLTRENLKALKPAAERVIYWDTDLKGLGYILNPTGAASYVYQYKAGKGRGAPTRRLHIGAVGGKDGISPEEARAIARSKMAEVLNGGDPVAELRAKRTASTMADLAREFEAIHLPTVKASTANLYRMLLRTHIVPKIGAHQAETLLKVDVQRFHAAVAGKHTVTIDGKTRTVGGEVGANRALALLAAMLAWGADNGLIRLPNGNPAAKVKPFGEKSRRRYLKPDELQRLGAALIEAETIGVPWAETDGPASKHRPKAARTIFPVQVTGALRTLLFTGMRLREVLHLTWPEVDLAEGVLNLEDSKTGAKTIPLSAPALATIASMPRVGRYVFAGDTAGQPDEKPRADLKKPWLRLCQHIGLEGVHIHDLRHTFASVGVGANIGLRVVGELLGHTQASTTQRYAHLAVDPLKRAADLVANQIDAALNSRPSGDVIQLRRGK